jgi:hypothetical protein
MADSGLRCAGFMRAQGCLPSGFGKLGEILRRGWSGRRDAQPVIINITQRNIKIGFDLATNLAGAKVAEVVELQAAYWRKHLE